MPKYIQPSLLVMTFIMALSDDFRPEPPSSRATDTIKNKATVGTNIFLSIFCFFKIKNSSSGFYGAINQNRLITAVLWRIWAGTGWARFEASLNPRVFKLDLILGNKLPRIISPLSPFASGLG